MHASRITSDNLTGASRKVQALGTMAASAMRSVRDWAQLAKSARPLTQDERHAIREGNRQHDERSVLDAGIREAKRLGEEAQRLGRPVTSDPYDRDLWPLHSDAWRDGWHDEAQRRLTETDC